MATMEDRIIQQLQLKLARVRGNLEGIKRLSPLNGPIRHLTEDAIRVIDGDSASEQSVPEVPKHEIGPENSREEVREPSFLDYSSTRVTPA